MPEDKPVLDLPRTLPVVGDDPVDDADIANLLQLGERADITDEQIEGVWRPEDEVEADKAGRRWARADEQLRQHDTELAKMFDQIDEAAAAQRAIALGWHERVTAEPERRKWFYERTLKVYIERIREDSGDEIKSKKLPAVVVDRRYVIYGDADVARAVARIEIGRYIARHQHADPRAGGSPAD